MTDAREKTRGAVHGFLDYTTPLWNVIGIVLSLVFLGLGCLLIAVVVWG